MFSAVAVFASDGDFERVVQVLLRELADRRRHGRREQGHLFVFRGVGQDALDVFGETHGEHLVGLVEHQVVHPRQVQRPAFEVVDDPAGGADHHLRTASQPGQLHAVGRPAVDRQHVDLRQMRAVAAERLGHLQGQLPGGREHQRLRRGALDVDLGQDRDREGRRLAGAGLRQSHHVGTRHQRRDGRRLDGRRRLVADVADRPQDRRVNLQVGEGSRGSLGRAVREGHRPTKFSGDREPGGAGRGGSPPSSPGVIREPCAARCHACRTCGPDNGTVRDVWSLRCRAEALTGLAVVVSARRDVDRLRFRGFHGRQDAAGDDDHSTASITAPATPSPTSEAAPPSSAAPTDPCAVNLASPTIAKVVSELPRDPRSQQAWNPEPLAGNYNECAQLSAVIVKANTNADQPHHAGGAVPSRPVHPAGSAGHVRVQRDRRVADHRRHGGVDIPQRGQR